MRPLIMFLLMVSPCYGQTFGLGECKTETMFGLRVTTQAKTEVQQSSPVVQQLTPVVRQARSYWTEGGRPWDSQTIYSHLLKHNVPARELVGRSLKEMVDMHDNIHEGYGWNGSVKAQKPASNCPGGVCPTYQPVRRFFRR